MNKERRMPINRSAYPPNWDEIAKAIKDAARWICQKCGKDCNNPGGQRERLTVHHLDHNPANCDPANLVALCSPCHLRADATWHAKNAAITRNKKARGPMLPLMQE
jgi:5-methylcytosine-specific restriction endonuclease McrA